MTEAEEEFTAEELALIELGGQVVEIVKELKPSEMIRVLCTAMAITPGWTKDDWLCLHVHTEGVVKEIWDNLREHGLSAADMYAVIAELMDEMYHQMRAMEQATDAAL